MDIMNKNVIEWDVDTSTDTFMIVLSIDAENKDNIRAIERIENELGLDIIKAEWKSKYNSYVVYDYEPCHVSGYTHLRYYPINNKTEFLKYLINKHLSNLNVLETYYNMEDYTDNEHSNNTLEIQHKRNGSKKNIRHSADNTTS